MDRKKSEKQEDNYIDIVVQYVNEVKYGSVLLLIQDGKVIQVEKTEKKRI